MMTYCTKILKDVLQRVQIPDEHLQAVRDRRREVLGIAHEFEGALRTYSSGSVAHGTAIFDADADCGVVMDRRSYPRLGPDGAGTGPCELVESVRSHVRDRLKRDHSKVRLRITKRAIEVTYNEPLPSGEDPTLDLIVALTRTKQGLWIPNTERDVWSPSDPEFHTELFTSGPRALRVLWARVVRLAKAWNGQCEPRGLSSFNIEALAFECIRHSGLSLGEGLFTFFEYSARELNLRLTDDPAGVSGPIKLQTERPVVLDRLRAARDLMDQALTNEEDEDKARESLSGLFWKFVDPPSESSSKAAYASDARRNALGWSASGLATGASAAVSQKPTRSYGDVSS